MADYKDEALAYLRKVIDETGRTATELARLVGVSPTTFTRPLNSPDHKYAVKFPALQDLAKRTGVAIPPSLLSARVERGSPPPTEIRLPIRYEVAASGFLERDELPQRPYGYRTVPSVAPYAGAPQWLERVVSDSLDKLIPVGSLAHVVDAVALEYEPRHDDIVIVERSRAQGALVERTIKQVALTPAGPELWPRSHNPRHQQAIALHDGDDRSDDVTVQIVGKVIRSYMFFEPEAEEPEVA